MGKQKAYVAFDLGAESGRGIYAYIKNGKVKLEVLRRFLNEPVELNGTLYWDLPFFFNELKKSIMLADPALKKNIISIGIDTWGCDYGLLDKKGNLLSNPVHYRDNRTKGMIEKFMKAAGREKIYEITGIQYNFFNTSVQLFAQSRKDPVILKNAAALIQMPDLLGYFFTGKKVSEQTIASTSQLYDAKKKIWSPYLLKKVGVPSKIMLKPRPAGTTLGSVKKDILKEMGASKINVVSVGGHDTASAVAATPAEKGTNWAYLSSGTWSLIGIETKEPVINETTLENNSTNEAGVYNTNRLIKNVMGLWLIQRCRKKWMDDDRKELSYPHLVKEAEKAKAFKAFVDPNDQSFYSTPDMPGAINAFLKKTGQKPLKGRGEIIRCVMESLAFEYRASIEVLGQLRGSKIEVLHILGGGSQNGPLCQFTADACGIKVVAGPVEATALGNIVVQAIVSKEIKDLEHARELIKNSFPLKVYKPANNSGWDDNYSKFTSLKKV